MKLFENCRNVNLLIKPLNWYLLFIFLLFFALKIKPNITVQYLLLEVIGSVKTRGHKEPCTIVCEEIEP